MPITTAGTPQLAGPGTTSPRAMTPPIVAETSVSTFFARNSIVGAVVGAPSATAMGGVTRAGLQGEEHIRTRSSGQQQQQQQQHMQQRRASAAEKYLEQFRREIGGIAAPVPQLPSAAANTPVDPALAAAVRTSPRASRYIRAVDGVHSRRQSLIQQPVFGSGAITGSAPGAAADDSNALTAPAPVRPRLSRSPTTQATIVPPSASTASGSASASASALPVSGTGPGIFAELAALLDGTHHTDELGVRFELGWPALEKHLAAIGGGKEDGDFGRVEIIYR